MKKIVIYLGAQFIYIQCNACLNCNKALQEGIFGKDFYTNLFMLLISFFPITILLGLLSWLVIKRSTPLSLFYRSSGYPSPVPLTCAGIILGIGIGGFIDGILFHQILQWHGTLSAKIYPYDLTNKSINMFWDGIFHFFTLSAVITGIYLLWKLSLRTNYNNSGYLLISGGLSGWGIFNCIEGVINHHLLKLHNVRELSPYMDLWNYGFLAFGLLLLFLGRLLNIKGQKSKN